MNKKDYQIVEPEILEQWLPVARNQEILVALLSWIVKKLQADFEMQFPGVSIAVVRVEYLGAYPAIGIHYPNDRTEDLAAPVEAAINRLLSNTSIIDFLKYVFEEGPRWTEISDDLLSQSP
ncbi:MAG: hypothetical protein V4488_07980 [Pseudomonadota bacterium]